MFEDFPPGAVIALIIAIWLFSALKGLVRRVSSALVRASERTPRKIDPDPWMDAADTTPAPQSVTSEGPWQKPPRKEKPMASKSGSFRPVTTIDPDPEPEAALPAAAGNIRFKTPDEIILATFGRVTTLGRNDKAGRD